MFSGLAAIAGRRTGNLGLEGSSALGSFGAGLAPGITAATKNIQQSRALATQERIAQQRLAAQQQQAAQMAQYRQELLAQQQQRIDLEKQKFQVALDAQAQKIATEKDEKKVEALADASVGWLSLKDEEKKQYKNDYINGLVKSGIITQEEGNDLAASSIEDMTLKARMAALTAGKAKNILDVQKIMKNEGATDGNTPLSPKEYAAQQKQLIEMQEQYNTLKSIGKEGADKFLTAEGKLKGYIGGKMSEYLPGVFPQAEKFAEEKAAWVSKIEERFNIYRKNITGAAAAIKELERLQKAMINAMDNPAEFKGKYKAYMQGLERAMKTKARLLKEGVVVGSEQFGQKFDAAYFAEAAESKESQPAIEGSFTAPNGASVSADLINKAAQKLNMTPQQFIDQKGLRKDK